MRAQGSHLQKVPAVGTKVISHTRGEGNIASVLQNAGLLRFTKTFKYSGVVGGSHTDRHLHSPEDKDPS